MTLALPQTVQQGAQRGQLNHLHQVRTCSARNMDAHISRHTRVCVYWCFTIFMGCVRTMPCRRIRFWWLSECMAFTSRMKSSRPSESNTLAFRHFTATVSWNQSRSHAQGQTVIHNDQRAFH